MALKTIQYRTQGTCCALMNIVLDGNKVYDVEFLGGCSGNLQGIRNLVIGMDIDDVISRLEGTKCRPTTSCPDQLAKALKKYKEENNIE